MTLERTVALTAGLSCPGLALRAMLSSARVPAGPPTRRQFLSPHGPLQTGLSSVGANTIRLRPVESVVVCRECGSVARLAPPGCWLAVVCRGQAASLDEVPRGAPLFSDASRT